MTTHDFNDQLPQFTPQEYEAEHDYFNGYDQEMIEAVNEADYYDYRQQQEEEEDVYVIDQGLLKLILDVQSYIAEAPQDSPLYPLQYKMYTYLKQRVSELGMDISSLL
ncbi:uncharacterized protein B0P05DRAFT_565205 [Gilbertella persicaria]|uniref:uncharacterized protein n=1 Tax=Gilbertella persicaria TaxID=101096 RepID=UPI0022211EAC|nr:uncharacterized protein B0P05DRAFT_565205 [Gilbertella persicaria]KAI8047827.1 hypothetical protein B0P05DRAFT_565205 [Gilbertella persicaria]